MAVNLLEEGIGNFALLFVVGEEVDGCGAKVAVRSLETSNVEFVINGEPTQSKLSVAQLGYIDGRLKFCGRAAHSGYPEQGIDANRNLINAANILLGFNFGFCSRLGSASINIGLISGGVASNVVSPFSQLSFCIRTVSSNADRLVAQIREALPGVDVDILAAQDPVEFLTLTGFDTEVARFGSDAATFKKLTPNVLQYGPGSILRAHSENEFITRAEIDLAISDYQKLVKFLGTQH